MHNIFFTLSRSLSFTLLSCDAVILRFPFCVLVQLRRDYSGSNRVHSCSACKVSTWPHEHHVRTHMIRLPMLIKVWQIYIHTYIHTHIHTNTCAAWLSALHQGAWQLTYHGPISKTTMHPICHIIYWMCENLDSSSPPLPSVFLALACTHFSSIVLLALVNRLVP